MVRKPRKLRKRRKWPRPESQLLCGIGRGQSYGLLETQLRRASTDAFSIASSSGVSVNSVAAKESLIS